MNAGRIIGLLLAGGRGSRFDPSGEHDKLLAPFEGAPVVARAADSLSDCDHRVAVLAPDKPLLANALAGAGCELLTTDATRLGLGHSIAAGVRHVQQHGDVDAVLVMLGDMPQVKRGTVRRLIAEFRAAPAQAIPPTHRIVAPSYKGQRGHPVIFGAAHLPALSSLRGDHGASTLLRQLPVQVIEVDDAGVVSDIDTREDLAVAGCGIDRWRDTPSWHAR